ncbi:hypothetical protein AAHA92_06547 [Salvia divinorum]|uniref:Uncharacterized protein n=1 Tax=Salvia divinorum TaxID=28513 RepID=A0ABD1I615_SALDI
MSEHPPIEMGKRQRSMVVRFPHRMHRRLESVWDDEHVGVSKCWSYVTRKHYHDCKNGAHNFLIRVKYIGWLLLSTHFNDLP